MTTRFTPYAERGERSYALFGWKRLARRDDSREGAYYLHHHRARTQALTDHLNGTRPKRGLPQLSLHKVAEHLGNAAHENHLDFKGFDQHNAEHHKRLAERSFRDVKKDF